MSDQDIIDTIAKALYRAHNEGIISFGREAERALAALRDARYEVVARPESLPLAALHEAMVAYDAYPSENAEDDYNPCMRVLDAARDLLDAEKAEEK
ncbi:MAG: hypothetical protein ACPGXI_10680 [Mycobacterium sp.]